MKPPKYYLKNSKQLGWEDSSSLDKQRLALLDKFLIGKRVLDVGCGRGLYTDYLSKKGLRVFGVDFVKEFIEFASKEKKGQFVLAKADKLPFEDKQFDTCLLFDILEHGDDLKILKEARRITRKRILLIVPRIVDKDLEQAGIIFRHYIDKSHLREYSEESLKDLAKSCSLKFTYLESVHPLYNETIFAVLFRGSGFWMKAVRKIVFFLLPKKNYPTEYFGVLDL